jgi:HSP20 family molecular chaperone IbpA
MLLYMQINAVRVYIVLAYNKEIFMSQLRTISNAELASLNKALIGFDTLFSNVLAAAAANNYPPHNIVKYNDTYYEIEVAVAGFTKHDIAIEVNQDLLTITGKKRANSKYNPELNERKEFLHRGLAFRDFEQTFTLAEYMEVKDAKVEDGMLTIGIERLIPSALQPRQIQIK